MAMATTTYEMEAMICGYHVYATVWDAQIVEELYCAYSRLTLTDSFATDIALEGTALADGPFRSESCESS